MSQEWVKPYRNKLQLDEPCYRESQTEEYQKDSGHFDFKIRIWKEVDLPEYFIAVPITNWDQYKEQKSEQIRYGILMKKARYKNTGRKFYINDPRAKNPFAFEYVFDGICE
jgi:hypothetical protein